MPNTIPNHNDWICPMVWCLRHDDVIKWKHFPRYWTFVRGNHRSPVNSPHKGQWRRDLMSSLICAWINGWVNNRKAGDFRRNRVHYGVIVMIQTNAFMWFLLSWCESAYKCTWCMVTIFLNYTLLRICERTNKLTMHSKFIIYLEIEFLHRSFVSYTFFV